MVKDTQAIIETIFVLVILLNDMTNGGVQGPMKGYNSLSEGTTASYVNPKWAEPYFDAMTPKNVTALVGKSAYLSCRVRNLGNKTVSWIRHRDIHILTVGSYTYTSDQRFQATYHKETEDWTLQIKWAQKRDAGMYECQISTQPVRSYFVRLNVVVPTATILGGPDIHVDKGSTINLTCTVKYSPEPPAYIFWYHHDEVINYDSSRGGVSVITEKGDVTTSFLLIQNADLADSGKYSCSPSNADVASVRVHVLNGEHPEAMQTGSSGCQNSWMVIVLLLLGLLCYNSQVNSMTFATTVASDSRSISSSIIKASPFHLEWVFQIRRALSFVFSKLIRKISRQMSGLSDSAESWTSDFSSDFDFASWCCSSGECTPVNRSLPFESRLEASILNIDSAHFAWCSEYARDILGYLRELEGKRKRIMFKSPQKHFRFTLVELIKSAAEIQRLNRTTVHLAVYLLDVFMDTYKIIPNKLSLVALTCILLAAKIEERDRNIPKMRLLSALVNGQYSKTEFKIVEIKILSLLNWNLLYPTAATYVECYACRVVSPEDFNNLSTCRSFTPPRSHFKSYNNLFSTANAFIFEFLDLTLQEPRIMHIEPSALAAACLAAARKLCGLFPLWPNWLQALTGYEIGALTEFVEILIAFREHCLPKRKDTTPDSGFLSDASSESEEEHLCTIALPFKRRKLQN